MSDLYANPKIRDHAESLVRNEIFYCVSSLVSSIVQAPDTWRALDVDEDEVYALQEMRDFDEPAADYIAEMDADDLRDYLELQDAEFDPAADVATLRRAAIGAMQDQGAAEFCDEFSIDPHSIEVYEHWIVSDYLARKLEAYGHPIARDFLGLTVWGRPTTGQSIAMDSVILEIARDAEES